LLVNLLNLDSSAEIETLQAEDEVLNQDLKLPQVAAQVARSTLSGSPAYVLLSLLYLQERVRDRSLPLYHLVLPSKPQYRCASLGSFRFVAAQWQAVEGRLLGARELLWELRRQKVPSLALVHLQRNAHHEQPGHTNFLLWSPSTGVLERFDPLPYLSGFYASPQLDVRLQELCAELEMTYMSAANSSVLHSLHTKHAEFSLAFGFFYLHTRLLHAAEGHQQQRLGEVYPRVFETALLTQLRKRDMLAYLSGYATSIKQLRDRVASSRYYDEDLPFWCNVWKMLKAVRPQRKSRTKSQSQTKSQTKSPSQTRSVRSRTDETLEGGDDALALWRAAVTDAVQSLRRA